MPFDKLSPDMQQAVTGLCGLLPTALLARFLIHHRFVQSGQRRFWSRELVWEGPTAIFCAVVGGGLASHFGLDLMAANAVVGAASWLGPRGLEAILGKFVERYAPSPKK